MQKKSKPADTRPYSRIVVDGVVQKTVDLYRSTFRPRSLLYSRSWKASGRHSLVIEILATRGHRLVAIDELVVSELEELTYPRVHGPPSAAPSASSRRRAGT